MACKRRQKYTTMDFAIGLSSPSGLPCERSCILGQSWAFVRGAHHGWLPGTGAATRRQQNICACADVLGAAAKTLAVAVGHAAPKRGKPGSSLGFFFVKSLGGAPTHRNIQVSNFPCMTPRAHIGTVPAAAAMPGAGGQGQTSGGRGRARAREMLGHAYVPHVQAGMRDLSFVHPSPPPTDC